MNKNRMITLLEQLVPGEGVVSGIIDNVDLFRITRSTPRAPLKYDPGIIILAQGHKRVFIGDDVLTYDPLHYLVLSVPLPLECETFADADEPMLGITVKLDAATVGEILLAVEDDAPVPKTVPKGIYAAALDDNLTGAAVRLLEALSSPADRRFLGPLIVREIIYRVVSGEKGDALRALAYRNQRFFRISRVLDRIHESYNGKPDLNALARDAGMSISSFHATFKSVTDSSPLQYIKNVKLHKARLLMLEEGLNATVAAYKVGYESPSQFNREYKRLFGITPARDAVN